MISAIRGALGTQVSTVEIEQNTTPGSTSAIVGEAPSHVTGISESQKMWSSAPSWKSGASGIRKTYARNDATRYASWGTSQTALVTGFVKHQNNEKDPPIRYRCAVPGNRDGTGWPVQPDALLRMVHHRSVRRIAKRFLHS